MVQACELLGALGGSDRGARLPLDARLLELLAGAGVLGDVALQSAEALFLDVPVVGAVVQR
jgi:hypothetical protein